MLNWRPVYFIIFFFFCLFVLLTAKPIPTISSAMQTDDVCMNDQSIRCVDINSAMSKQYRTCSMADVMWWYETCAYHCCATHWLHIHTTHTHTGQTINFHNDTQLEWVNEHCWFMFSSMKIYFTWKSLFCIEVLEPVVLSWIYLHAKREQKKTNKTSIIQSIFSIEKNEQLTVI